MEEGGGLYFENFLFVIFKATYKMQRLKKGRERVGRDYEDIRLKSFGLFSYIEIDRDRTIALSLRSSRRLAAALC
jgi:hypothetical protein